jgi:hypothetical protein
MSENESRLCVHQAWEKLPNFDVDRINVSLVDSTIILRQIAHFIRCIQSGTPVSKNLIDDFKVFEDEPTEDPRVCIVWNPETKQIRFSVIGMDLWQAEAACEHGAAFLMSLYTDFRGDHGGTDND